MSGRSAVSITKTKTRERNTVLSSEYFPALTDSRIIYQFVNCDLHSDISKTYCSTWLRSFDINRSSCLNSADFWKVDGAIDMLSNIRRMRWEQADVPEPKKEMKGRCRERPEKAEVRAFACRQRRLKRMEDSSASGRRRMRVHIRN